MLTSSALVISTATKTVHIKDGEEAKENRGEKQILSETAIITEITNVPLTAALLMPDNMAAIITDSYRTRSRKLT